MAAAPDPGVPKTTTRTTTSTTTRTPAKAAPPRKAPAKKAPAKTAAKPAAKTPAKAAAKAPAAKTFADYGYVKGFLDAHPDVAKKVNLAIKERWTPDRLAGEVKATDWWKNRSDSQRQWDMLSVEQKAEADKKVADARTVLADKAASMGVTIDKGTLDSLALQTVRDGLTQQGALLALANTITLPAPGDAATGSVAVDIDALRKMAEEYGVNPSNATLQTQVQRIEAGLTDVAGLEDSYREQAKALYAPIADILDKGTTVKGFVTPYLNIAAQQLGISTDMMPLTDTKWTGMIQQGKVLSADEWTKTIRNDAQYGWGKSEAAKREAYGLVQSLGSIFGTA